MSVNAIEIQNVSFSYPSGKRPALQDLTFNVGAGTLFGIVGPNGGGKTTLLKLLLGLLRPARGRVVALGRDISTLGIDRRLLGYVPQDTYIHPFYPATVLDVALMGTYSTAGLLGRIRSPHIAAAREALRQVGLADMERSSARALSGGQRQRLLIARALAGNSRVLVLDEPTSAIDADGQAQLFAMLKVLRDASGLTIVMVSHAVHLLLRHADEIVCLDQDVVWAGDRQKFDEASILDFAEGRGAHSVAK